MTSFLMTGWLLMAAIVAPGKAEDWSRLHTSSDLPRLAERGVRLPQAGRYTLKVWAPAHELWSLAAKDQTLTLSLKNEGDDSRPSWRAVGTVQVSADAPAKIIVAGATDENKSNRRPVPALVFISTDPDAEPSAALDIVRGRLDTIVPPEDPRRTTARNNRQGTNFHAPASSQAWRDRAQAVRRQLLVTLGLWPMFPKTELHPQVFGKLERDGYTIEKVVLETFPGFTLSGNLYRPTGKTGRLPGILCPHGHWEDGRVNPEVQPRCIRWAKLGCVVFMYDMVGYNDSKAFGHEFLNDRLRRWGLSLATLQTWNSIRALDWMISLPDVDAARIGCTGESGGGTQTFLLTAIDDRIKVSAPVVMVSDSFQGGCVCENSAGLRIGTDNVEFAALTAPRPLKLVGASGDWTARTMFRAYPAIRDVYKLLGSPDCVSAEVFNFPHNYNQTSRNAVYAFMARWLLGIEDAESTREGDQSLEKPEDLWAFTPSHPAPPGLKTPEQLETELINVMGRQIDKLAPLSTSASWEAARSLLQAALQVRVGLVNPAPAEIGSQPVRRSTRNGLTIMHHEVGRLATRELIPVVRLVPARASGRVTVILSPYGKAGLVEANGQPSPLVQALLDRGQSVIGFDPLLIGESVDPAELTTRRPETGYFDTYNPALAADRLQDLATVLAWARSQPDVLEVSLVGQGRVGPLALLARPALEGLARTAVDLHDFDYGDGSSRVDDELDLPGVLQFGGLKVAAALVAPAPLWISRPGTTFDPAWPQKSYMLEDASSMLRIDPEQVKADELARWLDTGESRGMPAVVRQ
jgi:hypothetical protein